MKRFALWMCVLLLSLSSSTVLYTFLWHDTHTVHDVLLDQRHKDNREQQQTLAVQSLCFRRNKLFHTMIFPVPHLDETEQEQLRFELADAMITIASFRASFSFNFKSCFSLSDGTLVLQRT